MLWVVVGVGVVIVVVGGVALVGMLLPQRHVVTRSAYFRQGQDHLWLVITDHSQEPSWRPGLERVERLPDRDGRPVWRELSRQGQAMTLETVESHAPRRLVRRIAGEGLPFGGSWIYEITAEANGSTLTITEDGKVFNPIFRFVYRFLRFSHRAIDTYLWMLGRHLGPADPVLRREGAPLRVTPRPADSWRAT